ncbi:MAG: hypothetical protein ACRDNL_04095 [Spirillospora sp.]
MSGGRLVRIGMATVASAALVVAMGGSASAEGTTVGIDRTWGEGTFVPHGEHVYVHDQDADGYSVWAKIERYEKVGLDAWAWRDYRTGSNCYDTTSRGNPRVECNYSFDENMTVRVCIVRKKDGTRYGDWQCSPSTKS